MFTRFAVTDGLVSGTDHASAREPLVRLRARARFASAEFRMTVETVRADVAVRADRVLSAVL